MTFHEWLLHGDPDRLDEGGAAQKRREALARQVEAGTLKAQPLTLKSFRAAATNPILDTADAFVPKLSVALRYGFARGRAAAKEFANEHADPRRVESQIAKAMLDALDKTLMPTLEKAFLAGGDFAVSQLMRTAGGPGSGNFGHAGRPGQVGGSSGTQSSVVETPEFKAWFGDSAVVDKQGNPLVVYHGTNADPESFRPGTHFGTVQAANERSEALYEFSTDVVGRDPGRFQLVPVYLKIENPVRIPDLASLDYPGEDDLKRAWEHEGDLMEVLYEQDIVTRDEFWDHQYADDSEIFALLESKGYDGIVYENVVEDPGKDSWVIFRPEQVKSAIGNKGTFDPKKALITAAEDDEDELDFEFGERAGVTWARRHSAELVKGITKTSRQRIRKAIADHLEGDPWKDTLDRILLAVGDEDRADRIARHETLMAVSEGQREAWDQAVDAGVLTGDEIRVWIVTPDERLCPICEELDGTTAGLGEEYPGGFEGPPAHVQCRCTEGIQSVRSAGGPGSGNFGHAGRPGEVGGSAPSGAWPLADDAVRDFSVTAHHRAQTHYEQWADSLSGRERYEYQGYFSQPNYYNRPLRERADISSAREEQIQRLQSTLERTSPPPPDLVWRFVGVDGNTDHLNALEAGDEIRLDGFQSATLDPNLRFKEITPFGEVVERTMLEIKPKTGAYVVDIANHLDEYEFLLPHGKTYRVRGVKEVAIKGHPNKRRVVQLEEL